MEVRLRRINTSNGISRVVHALGDSHMAETVGLSWVNQCTILSNGAIIHGRNVAVGGATIETCESVQVPLLAGIPCDELWIQIGANNYYESLETQWGRLVSLRAAISSQLSYLTIRWFGMSPRSVTEDRKSMAYHYNDMLRMFARDNGDQYHYGWQDIVDPADGGLLLTRNLLASPDYLHCSSYSHNLCAKRILAQLGLDNSDIYTPVGGNGTVPSNYKVSGPLSLMVDANTNGYPDIITSFSGTGGGTSTWGNTDAANPFIGKIFRRSFVGATSNFQFDFMNDWAIPPGDFDLMMYIGKSGESIDGLTLDIQLRYRDVSDTLLEEYKVVYGVSPKDSIFDVAGFGRWRIYASQVPIGAVTFDIAISTRSDITPFTCVRDLGMVQIIELN